MQNERERDTELPEAKRARAKTDAEIDLTLIDAEEENSRPMLSDGEEDRQPMPHEGPMWPARAMSSSAREIPLPPGLKAYAPTEPLNSDQPLPRSRGRSADRGGSEAAMVIAPATRDHSFAPSSVTVSAPDLEHRFRALEIALTSTFQTTFQKSLGEATEQITERLSSQLGGRVDQVESRLTETEEKIQELDGKVANVQREAWSEEALVTLIKKHSPRTPPVSTRDGAANSRPQLATTALMGPTLELRGWDRTTHHTAITEEATRMLDQATQATKELVAQVKVPYIRGSECHQQFKTEEGLQLAYYDLQGVCKAWPQRRWVQFPKTPQQKRRAALLFQCKDALVEILKARNTPPEAIERQLEICWKSGKVHLGDPRDRQVVAASWQWQEERVHWNELELRTLLNTSEVEVALSTDFRRRG
eukprot:6486870-Amphidinium_carterae.1